MFRCSVRGPACPPGCSCGTGPRDQAALRGPTCPTGKSFAELANGWSCRGCGRALTAGSFFGAFNAITRRGLARSCLCGAGTVSSPLAPRRPARCRQLADGHPVPRGIDVERPDRRKLAIHSRFGAVMLNGWQHCDVPVPSGAISHRDLTTVLTTMTTVGLPDASTCTTIELVSCLVVQSACAYGSEGQLAARRQPI